MQKSITQFDSLLQSNEIGEQIYDSKCIFNGHTSINCASPKDNSINELLEDQLSSLNQPKRLHVSNIPFRFREPDIRQLFAVSKMPKTLT